MNSRRFGVALVLYCLVAQALGAAPELGTSAPSRPLSPKEVFRAASRSVLRFDAFDDVGKSVGQGSAVVVERGLVITNYHVIQGAYRFTVVQGPRSLPADLIYCDDSFDLCLLGVQGLAAPAPKLRQFGEIEIGERVYAIGAPRGLSLTLSEGLVSGKRQFEGVQFIQTSASMSPGSSGGGLFDERARLVGVTTFAIKDSQNLNFAIPSDALRTFRSRAALEVLVSEHLQARGGKAALAAVQTIRQEGKAKIGDFTIPVLLEWKRPNLYRMDLWLGDQQTIQAFDGHRVWVKTQAGLKVDREVNPHDRWAIIDSAYHFLDSIGLDSRPIVEFLGIEPVGRRQAYKLRVIEEGGTERVVYLDYSSHLELRVRRSFLIGGRESQATIDLSDHRPFGGLLFPTRMKVGLKTRVGDLPTDFTLQVESVEINPTLEISRFLLPPVGPPEPSDFTAELSRMLDRIASEDGEFSPLSDEAIRADFVRYLVQEVDPLISEVTIDFLKRQWHIYRSRTP